MSKVTGQRVSIENNTRGWPQLNIDAVKMIADVFGSVGNASQLEAFEARAMAARLETLAGELSRAAMQLDAARIVASGGTLPDNDARVLHAMADAAAAPVSFNERRLVDCYHESPGLKALVEATREPFVHAGQLGYGSVPAFEVDPLDSPINSRSQHLRDDVHREMASAAPVEGRDFVRVEMPRGPIVDSDDRTEVADRFEAKKAVKPSYKPPELRTYGKTGKGLPAVGGGEQ